MDRASRVITALPFFFSQSNFLELWLFVNQRWFNSILGNVSRPDKQRSRQACWCTESGGVEVLQEVQLEFCTSMVLNMTRPPR